MNPLQHAARETARIWGVLGCLLAPLTALAEERQPQIWLAPLMTVAEPGGGKRGSQDFLDLFSAGAPWAETGARIGVFKIYPDFAIGGTDADLRQVINGLAARHIALALEAPILIDTGDCHPGVERGQGIVPTIARLKRLGADLRYFAMNGPLVGGHTYTKPGYCHATIEAVAADAAKTIQAILEIYPGIKFGDIEPVGHAKNYPDWDELPAWLAAFKAATGFPLAFLHTDVTWGLPWRDDLVRVASIVRGAGIPFGVIYNGDSYELSDADWAIGTARHYREVEALLDTPVDQAIFQSWHTYPLRALPETDPSTMTGIVRDYLRPSSKLTLVGAGRARLTTQAGAPIAGAAIERRSLGAARGLGLGLAAQSIRGTAPPDVTTALFALRVKTECECPARATRAAVAAFEFSQPGRAVYRWDLLPWSANWPAVISRTRIDGVPAIRINSAADQPVLLNGKKFPVTANLAFEASFGWQVDPEADGTGYAAVIFFGPDGIERHRVVREMRTTWADSTRLTTDADGVVRFGMSPARLPAGANFRLDYAGDAAHRPSSVTTVIRDDQK